MFGSLNLKGMADYKAYYRAGKMRKDIPAVPDVALAYKEKWISWGDWLGTLDPNGKWRPFEEAREYVRGLKFKNIAEYKAYYKSRKLCEDIPSAAEKVYRNKWISWGDWLGTETPAPKDKRFIAFEEAREHVRSLNLKSYAEYKDYCKLGKMRKDIPAVPDVALAYKEKWISWGDWLGTEAVSSNKRIYLPFEPARKFVHSLGLKNWDEWRVYLNSGQKPDDIPATPEKVYKGKWKGLGDWLGHVGRWNKTALLAVLDDLRSHLEVLDMGEICTLLQRRGALPAYSLMTRTKTVHEFLGRFAVK